MILWIIVVNLILLASAVGTIPVWIQVAEISKELPLIFGLAVLIIAMIISLLVVRKATMTKKKMPSIICAYTSCRLFEHHYFSRGNY